MTQDKELLLKDIYARIPYGVKGCCEDETFKTTPLHWYAEHTLEYSVNYMVVKNGWRPYLFPISSMTEEKIEELLDIVIPTNNGSGIIEESNIAKYMDWCYKNHLDINGLLPKGLAIDATGLNVY